ncbi:MAG: DoxX family protein [Gammaproteobacteria bacterium]
MNDARQSLPVRWRLTTSRLEGLGVWLAPLGLRLIMAWEFGEAGFEKLRGDNWFSHVQDDFPFPFSVVSTDISWFMATWFEIVGAFALLLGLCARFFAFSLLILTFVATAAVHWPDSWSTLGELWQGYAVSNKGAGNFKLPLLFALMLFPLVLNGAGKLSADHVLGRWLLPAAPPARADGLTWSLAGVAFGLPLATLFPAFGLLAAAGIAGIVWSFFRGRPA